MAPPPAQLNYWTHLKLNPRRAFYRKLVNPPIKVLARQRQSVMRADNRQLAKKRVPGI